MKKLLLIDVSNHEESRTLRLANCYINKYYHDLEIEHLKLNELDIKPLSYEEINLRSKYNEAQDFNHNIYNYAKKIKEAEYVVIAAPYYDLSYPSILKVFIEHIMCNNLTFKYIDDKCVGLCNTKKLIYITTSGGYINHDNYGYEYIKAISKMIGIQETEFISAEGLDIYTNDSEKIMEDKIKTL